MSLLWTILSLIDSFNTYPPKWSMLQFITFSRKQSTSRYLESSVSLEEMSTLRIKSKYWIISLENSETRRMVAFIKSVYQKKIILFPAKLLLIKTYQRNVDLQITIKSVRKSTLLHGAISLSIWTLLLTWQRAETRLYKVRLKQWWLLMFWANCLRMKSCKKLKFLS